MLYFEIHDPRKKRFIDKGEKVEIEIDSRLFWKDEKKALFVVISCLKCLKMFTYT